MDDVDIYVENHGTIFLLRPGTDHGREWINDHLRTPESEAPMMYHGATVVEHRFVSDIVDGMLDAGLLVDGYV